MLDTASFHQGRAFEFGAGEGIVAAIVTIVIASLIIRAAARLVIDRGGFISALLTAIVGTLVATFVWALVPGLLGLLLGIAVWALVAALFFRTDWVKGALIGVVAWVIWFLVSLLITWLFRVLG